MFFDSFIFHNHSKTQNSKETEPTAVVFLRVRHTHSCVKQNRECHSSITAVLPQLCHGLFNASVLLWSFDEKAVQRPRLAISNFAVDIQHLHKQNSSYSVESFYIGPLIKHEMVKGFSTVLISAPVTHGASLSIVNIKRHLLANLGLKC